MKPLLCILLLAATVATVSWPRRPAPEVIRVAVPTRPAGSPEFSEVRTGPEDPSPPRTPLPAPWAALQSGEFARFVQQLRASGCPEETVRIFALAALGRFHQQQVERPMRDEVRRSRYWQLASWQLASTGSADSGEPLSRRILRAQEALDRDLAAVGVPAEQLRQRLRTWNGTEENLLTEPQRDAVKAMLKRHTEERSALESGVSRGVFGQMLDDAARVALRELRQRQRGELAELLGESLAEAYELRDSPEADYVRQALPAAKDPAEFARMVAAARAIGVETADIHADFQRQHLPPAARQTFSSVRDQVMDRVRSELDPSRVVEIERERVEEETRAEQAQRDQREARSLRRLADLARSGGVELTDSEVRDLAAAIQRRGAELDREWGAPTSNPSADEQAEWQRRLREELERVAVGVLGERGRVVVEQMVLRESRARP